MSDPNKTTLLPSFEKMLEFTIRTIVRSTGAKAAAIMIVHGDRIIQSSASITPGTELLVVSGLRSLAVKIETGDVTRVEMTDKFKN